jgi:ribosome-associated protein
MADEILSKTKRKQEMHALQALGAALVELPEAQIASLEIAERLKLAVLAAKRIKSHEARRRQMQFIGKLMRPLDPEPIRAAIDEQKNGSAQLTLALHLAEQWRDKLIDSDDALGAWLTEHPDTDSQQLRALVRQARKDAKPEKPGEAPRHGKAYREIFQLVRQALTPEAP